MILSFTMRVVTIFPWSSSNPVNNGQQFLKLVTVSYVLSLKLYYELQWQKTIQGSRRVTRWWFEIKNKSKEGKKAKKEQRGSDKGKKEEKKGENEGRKEEGKEGGMKGEICERK